MTSQGNKAPTKNQLLPQILPACHIVTKRYFSVSIFDVINKVSAEIPVLKMTPAKTIRTGVNPKR